MNSHFHKGTVKWFNPTLGFGFIGIAPSLKQQLGLAADLDLYVHAEDLAVKFPRVLVAEQSVEFQVQQRPKGWRAVNVAVVNASNLNPETLQPLTS